MAVTWGFTGWRVLGSNQRRLSRRFYSETVVSLGSWPLPAALPSILPLVATAVSWWVRMASPGAVPKWCCRRVWAGATIDPVVEIRDYEPGDEQAWLRCRVLSFLGTAYFDDVMTAKRSPVRGAELVAVDSGALIGVLDLSVADLTATIDTIGVHPDYQRHGIGTSLFDLACRRAVELGAATIEAWTRDDEAALSWYRARGMSEGSHYLHVYADCDAGAGEPAEAVEARPGLTPVKVFLHAMLDQEAELRKKFRRVHVCRRFARSLTD